MKMLKILILAYLFYRYGFIWAIAITFLIELFIKYTLEFFFGLKSFSNKEYFFIVTPKNFRHNMTGFLLLDEYKPDKIKQIIIDKGIKQLNPGSS